MILQRITGPATPEKIFIVAKNSYATASLSNGQAVIWDYTTDIDGVGVTKPVAPTAANFTGFAVAGIAAETIVAGEYGLIQVYGYHSAVRVNAKGPFSATDIAKGSPLAAAPRAAGFNLTAFGTTTATHLCFPCAFALAAQTLSATTSTIAAFIKAL